MSQRREDKQEVQFTASFYQWLLITLITLSAGFITRHFISKIPLEEQFLRPWISQQPLNIETTPPEIHFSQGFKPIIGLYLKRISFNDPKCLSRSAVINDLLLIIDPLKLLTGKIVLSKVHIEHIDYNEPKGCQLDLASHPITDSVANPTPSSLREKNPKDLLSDDPIDSASVVKKESDPKKKSGGSLDVEKQLWEKRKSLNAKNINWLFSKIDDWIQKKHLSSLKIESLKVSYWHSIVEHTTVKTPVEIRFDDNILIAMKLDQMNYKGRLIPVDKSLLKIILNSERIQIDWLSSVREGKLRLQFLQLNDSQLQSAISLSSDQVPLSAVTGFFGRDHQLNYMWLNCQIDLLAPLNQLNNTFLKVEKCLIDGPYGKIVFADVSSTLSRLEKVKIHVDSLDLDQVIKNKRDLYLSGVIANYGLLNGELIFEQGLFQSTGLFENTEFVFSSRSRRDLQKIKKIPWSLSGSPKEWSLQIKEFDIENGEFDGLIEVSYKNQSQSEMTAKISVNKLLLDEKIYELMLGAKRALMKIYGQLNIKAGDLTQGFFLVATPELETESFIVTQLKINGTYEKEKGSEFKLSSQSGSLKQNSELFDWLKGTTLDKEWNQGPILFQEISAKATLTDRLRWSRGYMRLTDGWQMSSEGERSLSAKLSGWVQWDQPNGQYMKWDYRGSYLKGQWSPLTPWVQEWIETHPDFLKKAKNISFQLASPDSLGEKINEVRKKAVDKVKDALIPKEENKPTPEGDSYD